MRPRKARRLTQDRWESLLDRGIRDMETLLARYEADGADFLDGIPRLLPDSYYLGDFRGSAVYGFFASSRVLPGGRTGRSGLVEFLNARLRQLGREPVAPTAVLLTACGADETAGLKELVEKCHPLVVAPPRASRRTQASRVRPGPIILSAEELAGKGWFPVTPSPGRRGGASHPVGLPGRVGRQDRAFLRPDSRQDQPEVGRSG